MVDGTENPVTQAADLLGNTIRSLRIKKGYTLEEVAQRAELSAAMISKVESGQTNPSINSLRAISEALGVPVAYLFSQELTQDEDKVSHNSKQIYSFAGVTYTVVLTLQEKGTKLFYFEAEPGAERGSLRIPHFPHDGFEQGIVLSGRIEMTVAHKVYELGPMDTIAFPALLQHGWRNPGPETCRAVWAITISDLA